MNSHEQRSEGRLDVDMMISRPDPQTADNIETMPASPAQDRNMGGAEVEEVEEEEDLSDMEFAQEDVDDDDLSFGEFPSKVQFQMDGAEVDSGFKNLAAPKAIPVGDADSLHSNKSSSNERKLNTKSTFVSRLRFGLSNIWGWMHDPYEAYVDFMYHLFDLSFGMLMLYFTLFFYAQCIIFAFLIYFVGWIEPDCVVFDGKTLPHITEWFDACWTLSWTTFSTTGYGNTAPTVSVSSDGDVMDGAGACSAINILLMVISFVGIVYAGAAGAILYSKVEKIKGEGQVSFSDPCVVRFGSGLIRIGAEEEDDESNSNDLCPCPVLEFRILNHNHNTPKGVIANSVLRCLGSVEDERGEGPPPPNEPTKLKRDLLSTHSIPAPKQSKRNVFAGMDQRINLPRRLFINMELTNAEHPFFRRCWTATHVLDEKSPLIKKKMRDRIAVNNGFWPSKYNNARDIKKNIKFKQIIVNFTGVSKRTSKEVHAQHVYDIRDVLVGYQFINVLEKGDDDQVIVRGERLNDITEQNGNDKGEDLRDMIE